MKAIKKTPKRAIDYILDAQKMGQKKLCLAHHVNLELADLEFSLIRDESLKKAPRMKMTNKENLAYHIIQSHKSIENITPELCLEIAKKTAQEFTNNDYAYVVAVHTDKDHLHAHIIVNAYSHASKAKLKNYRAVETLLEISNQHCAEHGLSTSKIKRKSTNHTKIYSKKADLNALEKTARQQLKEIIDLSVKKANSYAMFLELLTQNGIKIETRGKENLAFLMPNAKRAIKLSSLKTGYSLEEIKQRIINEKQKKHELAPDEQPSQSVQSKSTTNQQTMKPSLGFKYYSDEYFRNRRHDFESIKMHGDILFLVNEFQITSAFGAKQISNDYEAKKQLISAKTSQLENQYVKLVTLYKQATTLAQKAKIKAEISLIHKQVINLNNEFEAVENKAFQFLTIEKYFEKVEKAKEWRR